MMKQNMEFGHHPVERKYGPPTMRLRRNAPTLPRRDRQRGIDADKVDEESAQDRLVEWKMAHLLPPKLSGDAPIEPSTTFHGQQEFNYKGQSWMVPPACLGSIRADGGAALIDH
jgi:hypothetical protein